MALLALPDGGMPDAIAKLDAQTVNTICNEIIDASGSIQWDDIAGAHAFVASIQQLWCAATC